MTNVGHASGFGSGGYIWSLLGVVVTWMLTCIIMHYIIYIFIYIYVYALSTKCVIFHSKKGEKEIR